VSVVKRVLVAGEINVDFVLHDYTEFPTPGKEVLVRDFGMVMGSASAIMAMGLARLGKLGPERAVLRRWHDDLVADLAGGDHPVQQRDAEAEGLDRVFREAGAAWREPGCSMCIAMNGDQLSPGQYAVSTSNRNFEGRQGKGGRTFLASPLTAAASAVTGKVTDVRTIL